MTEVNTKGVEDTGIVGFCTPLLYIRSDWCMLPASGCCYLVGSRGARMPLSLRGISRRVAEPALLPTWVRRSAAEANRKEEVMFAEDRHIRFMPERVKSTSLMSGDTFHWDGMGTASRGVGLTPVLELVTPAAWLGPPPATDSRASPAVPTWPMSLLPLPPQHSRSIGPRRQPPCPCILIQGSSWPPSTT